MYGYKLRMDSLPAHVWACETRVNDYFWCNRNDGQMVEISLSKAGRKTVIVNQTTYTLEKEYTLSCIVGDDTRESSCEPGTEIEITSVAVRFRACQWEKGALTGDDFADNSVLLLPAVFDDLSVEEIREIHALLHRYIKNSTEDTAPNRLRCISCFFELLSEIDFIVRKSLHIREKPTLNYYIKKINYILESRYREKLTEETVARELGISPGYLSALYKRATGSSFSEHLLQIRMIHAQELLLDPNLPTSKIAMLTGFSDESYFRKTFKKYFGVNTREYRYMKNSMTLYHEKPLRKP